MRKPVEGSTLTDAAKESGVVFLTRAVTASNARTVPYTDWYRDLTGVTETPAEHLQRLSSEDREKIEND